MRTARRQVRMQNRMCRVLFQGVVCFHRFHPLLQWPASFKKAFARSSLILGQSVQFILTHMTIIHYTSFVSAHPFPATKDHTGIMTRLEIVRNSHWISLLPSLASHVCYVSHWLGNEEHTLKNSSWIDLLLLPLYISSDYIFQKKKNWGVEDGIPLPGRQRSSSLAPSTTYHWIPCK